MGIETLVTMYFPQPNLLSTSSEQSKLLLGENIHYRFSVYVNPQEGKVE